MIDGLALPAFADHVDRLPRPWIALIHHPLCMETGLSAEESARFFAIEGPLMHRASRLIVTSPGTRRDLVKFDIDPARISVVLPGVERARPARGSGGDGPRQLLTVGSLTRRKGHLTLLEALAKLTDLDWHLNLVGGAHWDPAHAAEIDHQTTALGLAERVALVGEQDEARLADLYDGADLFVLASHHEGYGMVLTEALARALPIVSTTAGAIPETVPDGAGLLVPPGDPAALADAICAVLSDPEHYQTPGGRCGGGAEKSAELGRVRAAVRRHSRPARRAMSGFDPSWLALREPYDHAVRDPGLTQAFVGAVGSAPGLIDLGCGTGSNLRFLAPHLSTGQRWICIDHDPRLLAVLEETRPVGIEAATRQPQSRCRPGRAADRAGHGRHGRGLARSDVSRLAGSSGGALSQHARADDALLRRSHDLDAGRSHGRGDQQPRSAGISARTRALGPALGPDAATYFAERFQEKGHDVRTAPSDWRFGAQDRDILSAMVDGIAAAAREIDPALPVDAWHDRRRQQIGAGALSLTVGHLDLLALPR